MFVWEGINLVVFLILVLFMFIIIYIFLGYVRYYLIKNNWIELIFVQFNIVVINKVINIRKKLNKYLGIKEVSKSGDR